MRVMSLNQIDHDQPLVRADVCIIGAGAAGLYLAQRLSGTKMQVVVLEAGPRVAVSSVAAGFDSEFASELYRGATEGRAFGLGGTTTRWGGQLIPFHAADRIRSDGDTRTVWAHVLQTIRENRRAVSDALGLYEDADEKATVPLLTDDFASRLSAAGMSLASSRWLPFRRRNFARLAELPREKAEITIYCGAVAAEWRLGDGDGAHAHVREVLARSESGRSLRVVARRYVIAAGAIESTRLLLEVNAAGPVPTLKPGAAIGRYLSDHLSFRVGAFSTESRIHVARAFAPRFLHGLMRSWRFVETNPSPSQCRYFAHVLFPTDSAGFQLARSILQGLQARRLAMPSPKILGKASAGLLNIAWSRWGRSRLFIDLGFPSYLQLDMEQRPCTSNRVCLGDSQDRFGRRVAVVDWRISDQDRSDMHVARSDFLSRWSKMGPQFFIDQSSGDQESSVKPHDAYHPVGTCRLGSDPGAVVGLDLKVAGIENLYVLSTAIFPSAGSANPTFALLCFAEMLADNLTTAL